MLTGAGALNPMAPNPARSFPPILRRSKNGKSAGPANKDISSFASQRVHSDWVPQGNDGAKAQQNNYLQGLVAACLPTTQIMVHQGLLTPALPSAHCPPATSFHWPHHHHQFGISSSTTFLISHPDQPPPLSQRLHHSCKWNDIQKAYKKDCVIYGL